MYQWFYQQSTVLFLPVIATVIFMVVFSASVARAWLRYRQPVENEHMSSLPMSRGERAVPAGAAPSAGGSHV